jgi:hypothetical protein
MAVHNFPVGSERLHTKKGVYHRAFRFSGMLTRLRRPKFQKSGDLNYTAAGT